MKYLEYFDKDFFKFLLGFFIVVFMSVSIILFTNQYHCRALERDGALITTSPDNMC